MKMYGGVKVNILPPLGLMSSSQFLSVGKGTLWSLGGMIGSPANGPETVVKTKWPVHGEPAAGWSA